MQLNRVTKIDNFVEIRNVLISTADKSCLKELVLGLIEINPIVQLFSTGGTYNEIYNFLNEEHKKNLHKVSDYTQQPEMQGGLVKTLDFKIYLGLLSETENKAHNEDLQRINAKVLDMVVVNLYPFKEVIKQSNTNIEDARANIDIGGPSMLRAAAKNFLRVASVCDPGDYSSLLEEIKKNNGALTLSTRYEYAKKAFNHTAEYDSAISAYLLKASIKGVYDVH